MVSAPGSRLEKYPTYDRTSINAWEDVEFRKAVEGVKRKKIIMTALWTEACLQFRSLDMMKEGYEVYVGGRTISVLASSVSCSATGTARTPCS